MIVLCLKPSILPSRLTFLKKGVNLSLQHYFLLWKFGSSTLITYTVQFLLTLFNTTTPDGYL
jgi:hypothetical protein